MFTGRRVLTLLRCAREFHHNRPHRPPSQSLLRAREGGSHASCSGRGHSTLNATRHALPPASLQGKWGPLQNDVLENGPFQPPLRAPEAASKMQAHRRTCGLRCVCAGRAYSSTPAPLCGANSSALGRTSSDFELEEAAVRHKEATGRAAVAQRPGRWLASALSLCTTRGTSCHKHHEQVVHDSDSQIASEGHL